jgi:aldehyde dehydrogenase (NAD+)
MSAVPGPAVPGSIVPGRAGPGVAPGVADAAPLPESPADVVRRLRAGFDSGATLPLEWRREQLVRLRRLLVENQAALLEALRADLGKPEREALLTDLGPVLDECARAARSLRRWSKRRRVATPVMLQPGRSWIVPEPLGVVLVIAPWNYPVQLLLSPLVGALAAGNAVLLKPSEISASTSALLARLLPAYLDPAAVGVVEGGPRETEELLEHRFDHIFYTGNGRVARVILRAAAEHLTPVTLELGGKSPCLVDRTADLALTARRIAWGKFVNAGQTCVAPDYVLVPRDLEEPLIAELGRAIRDFYGEDPRRSADYARIVNARHHARLCALLPGANVALGGQHDAGELYLAPTVLRDVSPDAPAMSDEIFGPILPVLAVSDLDESFEFVRRRPRPLAAYAFSEDADLQERVLSELSAGGVSFNGTVLHVGNPWLPFGGVGESGMGAYHGRHSFETFSHHKGVYERSTRFDPSVLYPPYGARLTGLLKRFL